MVKNILGKNYFCVEVKTFEGTAKAAKREAEKNGYLTHTIQRFTENGKNFYTFTRFEFSKN